jgi:hypothetical protein
MEVNINGQDEIISRSRERKQPAVKRACNECRQQKLRCDVVNDPFQACSRCRRLHLVCKIDGGFKRVEKRRYFIPPVETRIVAHQFGRAKYARQQLEARQLGQPQSRDSETVAPPSAIRTQSASIAADVPEASASIVDLPTVPTIPRDPPAVSRSAGSQLSTYPTQRSRSEPERAGLSGLSKDSPALSATDTVRTLDGVELNAMDVVALFKM